MKTIQELFREKNIQALLALSNVFHELDSIIEVEKWTIDKLWQELTSAIESKKGEAE